MAIKTIQTNILEIAYLDEGPADGPVVFLLHGWPDGWAITLHGYRSRFLPEGNDPRYDGLQQRMSVIDKLTVPTLVIVGAADNCDDVSITENMEHCFTADYKRIVLEGIGHFPLREAPEAVSNALIKHFL
jgi:pimeloyl-ACP methyl ester carboxylesterase